MVTAAYDQTERHAVADRAVIGMVIHHVISALQLDVENHINRKD